VDSYTVYRHTGPTGKVYIGITGRCPTKRYDGGRGYAHCPHFSAAIAKYGWENFGHDILAEGLTKAEAEAEEVRLIAEYKSNDRRFGYNTDKGGSAPGRMAPESRAKIAEAMRGDKNPTRRYGHPFQGKKHTEESKRKMSAAASARTGRTVTRATREKLRQVQQKTPVRDIDSGKVYAGIHEAAEDTGLQATKICAVCKGKRKSTGGIRWEYVKE
jgi:group I intron endonuclease